jgi:hypothetical protein
MDATVINIETNNPAVEVKHPINVSLLNTNFCKYFLQAPCRCCGSDKHSLLMQTRSRSGKTKYLQYSCPVLEEHPDPSLLTESEILIETHLASHIKFAKHYNHEIQSTMDALRIYRRQGMGKFMAKRDFECFKEKVGHACHTYQNTLKEINRHKSLFLGSCTICGNKDHSALIPYLTSSGSVTYHYICPVSANENWEEACRFGDRLQKYRICPHKFSKEYQYTKTKALAALDIFKESNASTKWPIKDIEKLELEILEICDTHHRERQIVAESQNQENSRRPIYNLIQKSIHNLIKFAKQDTLRTSIQNLIDPSDRNLTRLVIHNLVIGLICIILIFSANVAFSNSNYSS